MPRSISLFERTLWAALALDLVDNFMAWPMLTARLVARGFAPNPVLMFASCVLSAVVGLIIWYFAARRRSVIAKWIFLILVVIGVVGLLYTLSGPIRGDALLLVGLTVVSEALKVYALTRLFTAEAKAWFAAKKQA